jgi:hypothetical protein
MSALLSLVAAFGLVTTDNPTIQTDDSVEARTARRLRETNVQITLERPNQFTLNNTTYEGIAVQLFRTDNPLELFNPFAGPGYGRAEANVSIDPVSGKAAGLKLFALRF